MRRSFLFLQGPSTPFFPRLADRLAADGHAVHHVNFCAGDALYWGGRPTAHFDGDPTALRDFYDEKFRAFGITDQVLFGDRRPVHRPAVEHAEACGIRTHVFEEGYFRPFWVTLEREGVNGHSLLPRDPDWFREVGGRLPTPAGARSFPSPFWVRAAHDIAYHVAGALNPLLYSRYRTHSPITAPIEYAGYLRRFARRRLVRGAEARRMRELVRQPEPLYLLLLQLNSDAQIRDHSRFEGMVEVIDYVLESFAHHAPAAARLAIKNHPLDMGLVDYPGAIAAAERRLGLAGRVEFLEEGDLDWLLRHARGTVTVNSTAGVLALQSGCPTITLSDPIYNLPGLTFQGALDDFWRAGVPPDAELFRRFRNVVIHATQVNGGFYTLAGIDLAIENSLAALESEQSPLEKLL